MRRKIIIFLFFVIIFLYFLPSLYFYFFSPRSFNFFNLNLEFEKSFSWFPWEFSLRNLKIKKGDFFLKYREVSVVFEPISFLWGELRIDKIKFQGGKFFTPQEKKGVSVTTYLTQLKEKDYLHLQLFFPRLLYRNLRLKEVSFNLLLNVQRRDIVSLFWEVKKVISKSYVFSRLKGGISFQKNTTLISGKAREGKFQIVLDSKFHPLSMRGEIYVYPFYDGKLNFKFNYQAKKGYLHIYNLTWKNKKLKLQIPSFYWKGGKKSFHLKRIDCEFESSSLKGKIILKDNVVEYFKESIKIRSNFELNYSKFRTEDQGTIEIYPSLSYINFSFSTFKGEIRDGALYLNIQRPWFYQKWKLLLVSEVKVFLEKELKLEVRKFYLKNQNFVFNLVSPLELRWGKNYFISNWTLGWENFIYDLDLGCNLLEKKIKLISLDFGGKNIFSNGTFRFKNKNFKFFGKGELSFNWRKWEMLFKIKKFFWELVTPFSFAEKNEKWKQLWKDLKHLPISWSVKVDKTKGKIYWENLGHLWIEGEDEHISKKDYFLTLKCSFFSHKGEFSYDGRKYKLESLSFYWIGDPLIILPVYRIVLVTRYLDYVIRFTYDNEINKSWSVTSEPPLSQRELLEIVGDWKLDFLTDLTEGKGLFTGGKDFLLFHAARNLKKKLKLDDIDIQKGKMYVRKNLSDRWSLIYKDNFNSQDSGKSMGVEYNLSPNYLLKLEKGDEDTSLKFKYKVLFGK